MCLSCREKVTSPRTSCLAWIAGDAFWALALSWLAQPTLNACVRGNAVSLCLAHRRGEAWDTLRLEMLRRTSSRNRRCKV